MMLMRRRRNNSESGGIATAAAAAAAFSVTNNGAASLVRLPALMALSGRVVAGSRDEGASLLALSWFRRDNEMIRGKAFEEKEAFRHDDDRPHYFFPSFGNDVGRTRVGFTRAKKNEDDVDDQNITNR